MGWWTSDRKAYALNFLIGNGLSPYGAAGLVSRWANVEAPNGPTSRGGYLNRAWGIAQWLGPRLPPIDGNPDFNAQLNYVIQELNTTEIATGAANALRTASTPFEGARAATIYERAGGWNPSTGTDNYTNRTLAGIPEVLALLSTNQNSTSQPETLNLNPVIPFPGEVNLDGTGFGLPSDAGSGSGLGTVAGVGVGTLLLIGAGLLTVYLITE